jgi:hypothetical protein
MSRKIKLLKFFGLLSIFGGGFMIANVATSCDISIHDHNKLNISSVINETNLGQIISTTTPTAQQIQSKVIELNSGADALD